MSRLFKKRNAPVSSILLWTSQIFYSDSLHQSWFYIAIAKGISRRDHS